MPQMAMTYQNIDEYISTFPQEIQEILHKVRQTIREAAPGAEEAIRYGMPTFVLKGNLVHFAAYKSYIGFYPAPSGIDQFITELAPYRAGKGTIQFPLDQPIPYRLISQVVAFRVSENLTKAAAKRKKQRG